MTVSRHIVEAALLKGIKRQLLDPKSVKKFKAAAIEAIKRSNARVQTETLQRQLSDAERVRGNLLSAIKQGIITPTTKEALEAAEKEVTAVKRRLAETRTLDIREELPEALERYRLAVAEFERRVEGHVEPARELLRALLGGRIRIHRREGYLEAEIPNHLPEILAMSLKTQVISDGCRGAMCHEPTFVALKPAEYSIAKLVDAVRA